MFKSLFGRDDDSDGVEIGRFEEQENSGERTVLRKGIFKILNTQIVYDNDESTFYTVATCVNEKDQLETIAVEDFSIDENVTSLIGASVEYEEYLEDEEAYVQGKIFVGKEK